MHSKGSASRRRDIAAAALAGLTAVLAFSPLLQAGWVNWDDPQFILRNPFLRALTPANLRWMATSVVAGTYQPLGWLTYALDFRLWGDNPRGFHLTSLLCHGLATAAVFALTRALLRAARPQAEDGDLTIASALGALLFAVHPLRVESVAWLSNRRELLAVTLYALGLWCYARERRGWALALIALSAAAKAVAIAAPAVLLVLDWYPLRRLPSARVLREKIPFLIVCAGIGLLGYAGNAAGHATLGWRDYGLGLRLAQCGYGLVFYAAKTVWPSGLSPVYEIPRRFSPLEPRFLACWALVAAISAWCWSQRARRPWWLAAWLCYAASLAPLLGLAQASRFFVADRYGIVACLSWSTLAAAGWLAAAQRGRAARAAASLAAGAVLAALIALSARQASYWRDGLSLWSRAAAIDPDSATVRNNLGDALAEAGRTAEARAQFEAALQDAPDCLPPSPRFEPECVHALVNLATARAQLGDLDGAVAGFRQVLALDPANEQAADNLARARHLLDSRDGAEKAPGR